MCKVSLTVELFQLAVLSPLVALALYFAISSYISTTFVEIVSMMINAWLCWHYPIKSEDGKHSLPTCPYRWPNGQGDVGKFLDGMENSELWAKEFGRVYRIWSGMTSEVVVTRPEDVQVIFRDSDKHVKAINNNSGWLFGELLGQCVGLVSQNEWRKLRSATEAPFVHAKASRYLSHIDRHTRSVFEELQVSGRLSEGLLNPVDDLRMLPFWIIVEVIYGELNEMLRHELLALVPLRESIFSRMISGSWTRFWWSQYLPIRVVKDLREFQARWSAFNHAAYQQALENFSDAPITELYTAAAKGAATRDQIDQTIDEILFANLDVTMGGLSWNLVFLAANPDSQSELRDEIYTKRVTRQASEWDQYLLSGSTLLAASVQESSRLRPLAAFSVPQAAPTDRNVSGFLIPADTSFVVDSYALNVRNPYWGNDSTSYRPRRFLERRSTETRYHYWRFGFGPRTCMGKHLADLIIRTLLAQLLENYRLSLVGDGTAWERDPETWITHPTADVRCEKL